MIYKVGIVEDQAVARRGLAAIIADADDLELAVSVENVPALERSESVSELDVVLLDFELPIPPQKEVGVRRVVEKLRRPVLVFSVHAQPFPVIDSFQAGASGFITKGAADDEIRRAISLVAGGGVHFSPQVAGFLIQAEHYKLTAREREILELVATGDTAEEIAAQIFVSVSRVNNALSEIKDKLGTRRRADLVSYAIRNRLDQSGDRHA